MLNAIFILFVALACVSLFYLDGIRYLLRLVREEFREMKWMVSHNFKTSKNAKELLANNAISPPTKTLILIYNSMFGMPLPFEEFQMPPGCAFTTNRRYWCEASAVVFHIPTLRRLPDRRRHPGQLWIG